MIFRSLRECRRSRRLRRRAGLSCSAPSPKGLGPSGFHPYRKTRPPALIGVLGSEDDSMAGSSWVPFLFCWIVLAFFVGGLGLV